jgi:hypothetical protein
VQDSSSPHFVAAIPDRYPLMMQGRSAVAFHSLVIPANPHDAYQANSKMP